MHPKPSPSDAFQDLNIVNDIVIPKPSPADPFQHLNIDIVNNTLSMYHNVI